VPEAQHYAVVAPISLYLEIDVIQDVPERSGAKVGGIARIRQFLLCFECSTFLFLSLILSFSLWWFFAGAGSAGPLEKGTLDGAGAASSVRRRFGCVPGVSVGGFCLSVLSLPMIVFHPVFILFFGCFIS